jgi:diguanylate cyclase (GGDEF)-like protein
MKFSLSVIGLIIVLGTVVVFWSFRETEVRLAENELHRGRSYFTQILITRKWNASFGGVYVEKKAGVESNPYLKNPEVTLEDGRIFTLRNPAFMTREISEIAENEGLFRFHITSLDPLNPKNGPDDFERVELVAFGERNRSEASRLEMRDGRTFFRYMAPLWAEASCLACHAEQGYKVGDLRGGISVSFDVTDLREGIRKQRFVFGGMYFLVLTGVLGAVLFLIRGIRIKLKHANEQIRTMAATDELTGLDNRRRFMERLFDEGARSKRSGLSFGVGIFDLDHFKVVNDTYGHITGDVVLKEVASRMRTCARDSDTIARYGGEEFSAVFSGTDSHTVLAAAERIRYAVNDKPVIVGELRVSVTISGGVSVVQGGAGHTEREKILAVLSAADNALYAAKRGGRNRVNLA